MNANFLAALKAQSIAIDSTRKPAAQPLQPAASKPAQATTPAPASVPVSAPRLAIVKPAAQPLQPAASKPTQATTPAPASVLASPLSKLEDFKHQVDELSAYYNMPVADVGMKAVEVLYRITFDIKAKAQA